MVGYIIVNIVGTVVLITVAPNSSNKGGLLFTFYLMQCCQAVSPSMWSMLSRNVAGQTKKSICYALFCKSTELVTDRRFVSPANLGTSPVIGWAGGNAIGPQLFQAKWSPRYLNSLYIHLGIYVSFIIDVLVIRYVCKRRNTMRDDALQGDNIHAHAFEDMTDLQNRDFRYSY
jgi:hypothetical protein